MIDLIAQVDPKTFWNEDNGSTMLWIKIAVAFVIGCLLVLGLMAAPTRLRRPIVVVVTFVSGLFYFLAWIWPAPIARQPNDAPRGTLEGISFWLDTAQPVVANFTNVLTGFLLGLGIISLVRVHGRKVARRQRDWPFSVVLLSCVFLMALFGYWDWGVRYVPPGSAMGYVEGPGWGPVQYVRDLLFDGLLQQMDAAMFSLIAFYILSAAYRAFRARSVEATVLLAAALVMILSLMGLFGYMWNTHLIAAFSHNDPNSFANNFQVGAIAKWIKDTLQTPSIRGIDFGVGIGLLAMALRIWLSLEPMGTE